MLGYSLGSTTRVVENIVSFYLVFYLTLVIGIEPVIAGAISSGALLWGSFISPFIGHYADRPGRKRKLVLLTTVPLAVFQTLLFTSFDLNPTASIIYYLIIGCLCYSFLRFFSIPYDALGAELSQSYDMRSTIRALCTFFIYLSVVIGGTLTLYLQGLFYESGNSLTASWVYAVLPSSIVIIISGLSAWISTKHIDKPLPEIKHEVSVKSNSILNSFKEILKIKPFVALLVWCALFYIAFGLLVPNSIYFRVFYIGMTESEAAFLFTVGVLASFVSIPIATILIKKFGKRSIMIISMLVYIIPAIAVLLRGAPGPVDAWILAIAYGLANSTALITSFSMLYDIGELTEIVTGEKKTTPLVGAFTFIVGISKALGYVLFGLSLQVGGFNSAQEAQSEHMLQVMLYISTIVPATLIFLSIFALLFYRINKNNFNALLHAIELKKNGKSYSPDGFKELL